MNVDGIVPVISILASLAVITTFLGTRRRAVMEEGRRQQEMDQLKLDVARAWSRVQELEIKLHTSDMSVREIVTHIQHVLTAIERLEGKLDTHLSAHAEGAR